MKVLRTVWKILGSAKFAIPLLGFFSLAMILGTILESRFGTQYATRTVYFTWWFFVIQALMVLSLIVAVLDRLPVKKRLAGFYIVHAAIVLIIAGSVFTKIKGLDGELQLSPNEPAQFVRINEDQIYIATPSREYQFPLPARVTPLNTERRLVDEETLKVDLIQFFPYANFEKNWVEAEGLWASEWLLRNDDVAEKVELMSPASSLVPSEAQLGPLSVSLVSWAEFSKRLESSAHFFSLHIQGRKEPLTIDKIPAKISLDDGTVVTVKKIHLEKSSVTFIEVGYQEKVYKFFPKYSEFPMLEHLEVDKTAHLRLFGNDPAPGRKNQVLISRNEKNEIYVAYQTKGQWKKVSYEDSGVELPWMKLRLSLLKERRNQRPILHYQEGQVSKEAEKNTLAAKLKVTKISDEKQIVKEFWISDMNRENLELGDLEILGFIGKKLVKLPFFITLTKFKMETNPGTEEAASYESYVKVGESKEDTAHIYMNHPLKKDGFTFYQASYFQDDNGEYHSVLSVNQDPGRWLKYLGSLVLVVGLLIHYVIVYRAAGASKEV